MRAGERFGPYEVLAPVGSGGMGEVWKARDTRLDRTVAIKCSAQRFSERFEREAHAIGALNHPRICTLYDVGPDYLVMEFVDGKPLHGPLPLPLAIEYGAQIAEALHCAHSRGIVHRDLKPGNILVTKSGIKLLDFGLAKIQPQTAVVDTTVTLAQPLTQDNAILGTLQYMSPEVLEGKPADIRSDIFAFGLVLYEMISGRQAFHAASQASLIAAILDQEPAPLPSLVPAVPPALDRLVRKCMEKDPDERFQSAADLAYVLGHMVDSRSEIPAAVTPSRRRVLLLSIAAPAAGAGIFAGFYAHSRWRRAEPPRFQRLTFRPGRILSARFLGDGSSVAYEAEWEDGTYSAHAITPSTGDARDFAVPKDAGIAAFSRTGELALFLSSPRTSGYMLARRNVAGSPPRELADGVRLAEWGPDGESLAVTRVVDGKERMEFPIGRVLFEKPVTALPSTVSTMRVAPDGRSIVFVEQAPEPRLKLVDLDGRVRELAILTKAANGRVPLAWGQAGREVWSTSFALNEQNTILAFGLNGSRRVVARFPHRITLLDVSAAGQALVAAESVKNGIIFQAGDSVRDLSWLDDPWLRYISPDGSMVIFSEIGEAGGKSGTIFMRRADGSPPTRLGDGFALSVSGDGKWIYAERAGGIGGRFIPVGAGEGQDVRFPALDLAVVIGWLGQENFVVAGNERGRPYRHFICNRLNNEIVPITPEGTDSRRSLLTPDRSHLLARTLGAKWLLYPLNGGASREVLGINDTEVPVVWSSDGRSVFVTRWGGRRLPVYRVDMATGARELWKEISSATPNTTISLLCLTPDGRNFAYQYTRHSSELYLADGLS